MNTLYILIGLLAICVFLIPNKRRKLKYHEKFNNTNKFSLRNSLKTIPNIVPHLII